MKCHECGGDIQQNHGPLELHDSCIGDYTVPSVDYYKCSACGDLLFPPKTSAVISKKRSEILDELIGGKPINSFLSAAETASILGITRQALHKHGKIRRGFIYQTQFGGKSVYLKESVILYKETGDGRFSLVPEQKEVNYFPVTSIGQTPSYDVVTPDPPHVANYRVFERMPASLKQWNERRDDVRTKGYH
jgi:hypothetical protein